MIVARESGFLGGLPQRRLSRGARRGGDPGRRQAAVRVPAGAAAVDARQPGLFSAAVTAGGDAAEAPPGARAGQLPQIHGQPQYQGAWYAPFG